MELTKILIGLIGIAMCLVFFAPQEVSTSRRILRKVKKLAVLHALLKKKKLIYAIPIPLPIPLPIPKKTQTVIHKKEPWPQPIAWPQPDPWPQPAPQLSWGEESSAQLSGGSKGDGGWGDGGAGSNEAPILLALANLGGHSGGGGGADIGAGGAWS